MKYESAIVIERFRDKRVQISILVLLYSSIFILIILFSVVSFYYFSNSFHDDGNYSLKILLMVFLYSALGVLSRILSSWQIQAEDFKKLAISSLLGGIATVLSQLSLLNIAENKSLALFYGAIIGVSMALIPQTPYLKLILLNFQRLYKLHDLFLLAKHYLRFPKYMVLFTLNSTLRDRVMNFIIASLWGGEVMGKLSMSQRIAFAPQSLVHPGVSPVIFGHASKKNKESVSKIILIIVEFLSVLFFPIFIISGLYIEGIVKILLGGQWASIGENLRWMLIPGYLMVSTSFLDKTFDVYSGQRKLVLLEILFTLLIMFAIFITYYFKVLGVLVPVYSILLTIYSIACLWLSFNLMRIKFEYYQKTFFMIIKINLLSFIFIFLIDYLFDWIESAIILTIITFIFSYYFYQNYIKQKLLKLI